MVVKQNGKGKSAMAMLTAFDESELEEYLESADEEIAFQGKAQERRKQAKGRLWRFKMPDEPNGPNNTYMATGRFLRPLNYGVKVLEHDMWGTGSDEGFRIVCPGEYGFQCEYCTKILKKYGKKIMDNLDPEKLPKGFDIETITPRQALYMSSDNIYAYASKKEWGFRTQYIHVHYFWYYEDNGGKGGVRLFAFAINNYTPMQKVINLNKSRFTEAGKKGSTRTPHPICDYDVAITATVSSQGENLKTYDVIDEEYYSIPDEIWEAVASVVQHPLDQKHLRWDYAIGVTNNPEWLEKYRKAKATAFGEEYIAPAPKQQEEEAPVRQRKPFNKPSKSKMPVQDLDDVDIDMDDE